MTKTLHQSFEEQIQELEEQYANIKRLTQRKRILLLSRVELLIEFLDKFEYSFGSKTAEYMMRLNLIFLSLK